MKTKFAHATALIVAVASLAAAPLTQTTAVHTRPDAGSPVIAYLKAGTEPTTVLEAVANTPAGWMAVELTGPFEAYLLNKDLTKSLDVVPGAQLLQAPNAGAALLTIAAKDDKVTITGLHGKWTQISLSRKLTAFIAINAMPGYLPPIATAPATRSAAAPPLPPSPAPAAPIAYGTGAPGRAAPMVNLGDGGAGSLPRQFVGRFVSTRRPFTPRRPFDWALNDDAGRRYAYLDVSKLLLTEQIEKYLDHGVVVYGAAKNAPDGKDLVIAVESLQLR